MLHSFVRASLGLGACLALLRMGAASVGAAAADVPCDKTTITKVSLPTGPAQYQSGTLLLGNGASLRVQGGEAEMYQVKQMQVGDSVATCYGPPATYADAGPSRTITVLDLRNGNYYGALVGNWPL